MTCRKAHPYQKKVDKKWTVYYHYELSNEAEGLAIRIDGPEPFPIKFGEEYFFFLRERVDPQQKLETQAN